MEHKDLLLAYSEWLDGEGLIRTEAESGDERPHERLANDFIEERA